MPGLHGVDNQLVTVVVDQDDQLEWTTCRIHTDNEPAAGVILVIEWARIQGVRSGVENGSIIKTVASIVLPSGLVQVRQYVPIHAPRPG